MIEDIWTTNKQVKDGVFHGHSPSSKKDLAIGELFQLHSLHMAPIVALLPKHWCKNIILFLHLFFLLLKDEICIKSKIIGLMAFQFLE